MHKSWWNVRVWAVSYLCITGRGGGRCVNSVIASLLFRYGPDELKFIMVDPKMVELAAFNGLPHLLCPVVTDPKKVSIALNWVVNEMESRYKLFAKNGARNINYYNKKILIDYEFFLKSPHGVLKKFSIA